MDRLAALGVSAQETQATGRRIRTDDSAARGDDTNRLRAETLICGPNVETRTFQWIWRMGLIG